MSAVQNNTVSKAFERVANHTDTLAKASKVLLATLDVAFAIFAYFPNLFVGREGLDTLRMHLKDTGETSGAFAFAERAEWLDAKKRKEILNQPKAKVASKVTLTAAQILTVISFFDKLSYRYFSQASRCIGALPIIDFVKNLLFAVSSALSLYVANIDRKRANATFKKEWRYKHVDNNWVAARKDNKYVPELQVLTSKANKTASEEARKRKLEGYLQVLQETNGANKFLQHKVTAYTNRAANAKVLQKKAWAGIVAEIAKLFMITVGTTIATCSLAVTSLSLPVVTLVVSACGLAASIIALWKNLYIDVTLSSIAKSDELRKGIAAG